MSYENIDKLEKPFDFWRGGGCYGFEYEAFDLIFYTLCLTTTVK